ncbi:MAG: HAMP domain-containing histidine kinase [Gammaproteobacteria bacterium]|nr:HAMP domain-containing histidine kinase [Gammaproteobacteria bacterium]
MKHRISLRSLLIGINLVVFLLPVAGVQLMRLYESALVRQTESALIAQAAFVAAFYRSLILEEGTQNWLTVTRPLPKNSLRSTQGWLPQPPTLDLATSPTLPPLPDGTKSAAGNSFATRVGKRLMPVLKDAQLTTLAGIRVVDPWGVIIASTGNDAGLSIVDSQEISTALSGLPVSTIRQKNERVEVTTLGSVSRTSRIRVFVATPIIMHDRLVGAVMLSRTPPSIIQALYAKRWLLLQGLALLIVLVVVMSLLTFRLIARPIRRLADQTTKIALGELTAAQARLSPEFLKPRTVEIARLQQAISNMADALEQRANHLQEFSRHVSHEFKTPIASIRAAVEVLQDHGKTMDNEQHQRFLTNITDDALRLHRLTQRLMDLTKAGIVAPALTLISVHQIVQQLAPQFDSQLTVLNLTTDRPVKTNESALSAALETLLENAIEHGASEVKLWLQDSPLESDNQICLLIEDNGTGISKGNKDRIFEPFFTTRRESGGTGLGLTIARTLVRQAQGELCLVNELPTTFQITLAVAD